MLGGFSCRRSLVSATIFPDKIWNHRKSKTSTKEAHIQSFLVLFQTVPAPEAIAAAAARNAESTSNSLKNNGDFIPVRSRGQPRQGNRRTTSERC